MFWIGDLNYRIDMEINQVKDYVKSGALHKLMPLDQVKNLLSFFRRFICWRKNNSFLASGYVCHLLIYHIIIKFLINVQVQGHHPHQRAPFHD